MRNFKFTTFLSSVSFFGTLMGLLGLAGCTTYPAPNWHTDRGSLAHTASLNDSVTLPLEVRWQQDLSGVITASAIGSSGNVVIGAGDILHALDPTDGTTVWSYDSGSAITNSATAFSFDKGATNRLVFIDGGGDLHCLEGDDGSLVWHLDDGVGSFNSATNFATNYVFYTKMATGVSSALRAVDVNNGTVAWEENVGNISTATPMHGFGRVFYGTDQQSIRPYKSYNAMTGDIVWEYDHTLSNSTITYTNGVIDSNVEVGQPAKIYFGIGNNPARVKAVTVSQGSDLWNAELPNFGPITGFALTQERSEKHLIVTQRDRIYRLDTETGDIMWDESFAANSTYSFNRKTPQPLIWGDYVFHITGGQVLRAYYLDTGQEAWSYDLGATTYGSPIAGGKTLYIGTSSGSFYAFSEPDN